MPVWLRMFTFHKIQEYYENQNNQVKQATGKSNTTTLIDEKGNVNKESFQKITNQTPLPENFRRNKK